MSIDTINEATISSEQRTWFNPKGPDAPMAWYGGKHYMARWIIEQMPEHRVYVEPFGGMAGVLLKKEQSEVEIFNDLDGRAINFFRVIRNRDLFEEFKLLAELTPYSREEFQILCETTEPTEPIQRAWWFFVRCRQARGGTGMDAIVSEGAVQYHTAGALGKGERIWMLAKLPDEIRVKNSDDVTEKYLLLSNSHDGSSSLRVHFTPIRVVCANTLAVAERKGRGQGISIVHKGDLHAKVQQAQEVLGLAKKVYEGVEERINRLAYHYPSLRQLEEYFKFVYPDPTTGETTRAKNIRKEFARLFEEGIGHDIPAVRHTSWAALNAVTEFVDHYRTTRGKTPLDRASKRLESAWFGSGAQLKQRAWTLAMQMAT
jgi:phage/plasmid-like protein (TIGR03299 family)